MGEEDAKNWLKKQAIWQIYLPAPKYIPRPKFDISIPNKTHQADLLFLPHDRLPRGRKIYKYALTVVDVASRYKEAEPLTSKESAEVAKAFSSIYKRKLKWPKLLQVDPGKEFMGVVNKLMKSKGVEIRRGEKGLHRAQGIVERFNRTLSERLFGHQYAQEMLYDARNIKKVRSAEWVVRLPSVISALNNETTRLINMKPADAIKKKEVIAKSSLPLRNSKGVAEEKLTSLVMIRYLYQPGELEGGEKRRATDPVWSLGIHTIGEVIAKPGDPIIYYLNHQSASVPRRSFVRQELLVIPFDTQAPPDGVLKV